METQKMGAVVLAQALVYASPSYEKKDSTKKQRIWNKFMDSLDWEKIGKKPKKPHPGELKAVLGGIINRANKPF